MLPCDESPTSTCPDTTRPPVQITHTCIEPSSSLPHSAYSLALIDTSRFVGSPAPSRLGPAVLGWSTRGTCGVRLTVDFSTALIMRARFVFLPTLMDFFLKQRGCARVGGQGQG